MLVRLGPIDSAGALLWIAYARTVLAELVTHRGRPDIDIDLPMIERFETYLDQWEELATSSDRFDWSTQIAADDALALASTWFELAQGLAIEADVRGFPLSPPEGEAFYQALVRAFLESLLADADTELAAKLRHLWPGIA
jgi:hypothetical protein